MTNEQTSTILAQKSVALLRHCFRSKDKIPRALKRFVYKLLRFLLRRRFCRQNWCYAQLYTSSISRYFLTTMPQEARIRRKGKILRWNKHAGQQADPVSVHCPQTNEKSRDKMRIRLGCSTTHGRPKLVPHWIPQFHQIFTSSASSKTKTDKKFSCVFVRTSRRTKAKLVSNKS